MADVLRCPKCGQGFTFRPELAGKRVRCGKCGNVYKAPAATAEAAEPATSAAAAAEAGEVEAEASLGSTEKSVASVASPTAAPKPESERGAGDASGSPAVGVNSGGKLLVMGAALGVSVVLLAGIAVWAIMRSGDGETTSVARLDDAQPEAESSPSAQPLPPPPLPSPAQPAQAAAATQPVQPVNAVPATPLGMQPMPGVPVTMPLASPGMPQAPMGVPVVPVPVYPSTMPVGMAPGVGIVPPSPVADEAVFDTANRPRVDHEPPSADAIDLLRLVPPSPRSTPGDEWRMVGATLSSPRDGAGALALPVEPLPDEYRLTIVAERTSGDDGLYVGLSVDGHPVTLVVDGWQSTLSGLNVIDGKRADQNPTAFRGSVFQSYRPATIICTVGPGSVDATVDGRTIVHWTGDSNTLGADPQFGTQMGNGLGVAVLAAQFRIRRFELASLGGKLPPVQPAVAAWAGDQAASGGRSGPLQAPSEASLMCVALIEHPLGSASGFAIANNLVVTNAHVVEGVFPDEIKVHFGTENSTPQQITRMLYYDRARDLCLLELAAGPAGLEVRGDYTLKADDKVILMGNPSARGGMLMRNAVNQGRVTSVVRIDGQDFYQISATVTAGWSGGPVVDKDGKVIAVVAKKADDRAVEELRSLMARLDQTFLSRIGRQSYGTGLTYGIPASALAKALANPALHDKQRQDASNDRNAAQTLVDRLGFLADLALLRSLVNITPEMRDEARAIQFGLKRPAGRRPGKADILPPISEYEARKLREIVEGDEITAVEEKFRERLDDRLAAVQQSPHVSDAIQRDLKLLARTYREAAAYSEKSPSGGYMAFSEKIKELSETVQELQKRLAEAIKEQGA